ncbi:MAG: YjgP/YjgQ family permease [Ignavibacteria bacterium]|nr:YjgP/YjgQ family permease [Ignavibacteria bacterium]
MIRIITRYVLRQYLVTVLFAVLALTVLFVLVDLFNQLDKFLDHKTPGSAIVEYYFSYVPQIVELITPIAIMLSGLFSIGRLSNLNEITAMRAGGISTTRLLLPILAVGLLLSAAQLYFNGWVVPVASRAKVEIERRYLGNDAGRNVLNDMFFREQPMLNITISRYDIDARQGSAVTIEEFSSSEKPRMVKHWDVGTIMWDSTSSSWVGRGIVQRAFSSDPVRIESIAQGRIPFTTQPSEIMRLQQTIDEMTFTDIEQHIRTLRKGGKETRGIEIDLAGQWAFPFVNVIVIMLTAPFAAVRMRGGAAVNISLAMIVSISYIAFTKIGQAVGTNSDLPVWVVGWSSNIIFGCLGLMVAYRFRK